MPLSTLSRKFTRNLWDYGWATALGKALAYLISPFYERRVYRLYRISTRQFQPAGKDRTSDIRIELLSEDDSHGIAQVETYAEWFQGQVQSRLKSGDLCFVARDGNDVVAFNLVALCEVFIPLLQLHRRLRPTTAWSDHIMVARNYRKRGLATRLRQRVLAELNRRGIKKLYGGTLRSNQASLALTRRVGFQEFADVEYRRLLNRRCWQVSHVKDRHSPAECGAGTRPAAVTSSRTRECYRLPASPG